MKIKILPNADSLCDQCVGLCCRYYALGIDKPQTKRDFEDLRWFLLHEGTIIFVEEGDWYVQVNRKCKALLPNNRCAIYENRPAICREYKTKGCDWHADEYDYDELFVEPEQIERYGKEYLARRRKRRRAVAAKRAAPRKQSKRRKRPARTKASPVKRSSRRGPARCEKRPEPLRVVTAPYAR
jgi:Fe-S-cluster containining protein